MICLRLETAYEGKISFNPVPSKQAQEAIFSDKIKKPNHPVSIFSNNLVNQTLFQTPFQTLFQTKLLFGIYLLKTSWRHFGHFLSTLNRFCT